MKEIGELFQTADWKKEKHVPVIEFPDLVKKGDSIRLTVTVGKEIAHPNTSEHHIGWIDVYFLPEGDKYPGQLGRFEFKSHGASAKGPDTSTIYTNPETTFVFKTDKPGSIIAFSYCNIHGLWSNVKDLRLV